MHISVSPGHREQLDLRAFHEYPACFCAPFARVRPVVPKATERKRAIQRALDLHL